MGSFIILIGGFRLELFSVYQKIIWFRSCLAETNRTPFDFTEGESELVSGFNTEYGAGGFALIFIAEYARILFIRILFVVLFLGRKPFRVLFYLKGVLIAFVFV